ncbi:addiction module antidote protein, HigA family [Jiella endophytica]|uniref:Addiction module antidote protein, HigA family n=1 Tax=Jiella endophytica TaxID=2558362 RepID=A0A4Y8RCH5_9HYPH|nr:HigA family addiction module antitoxin [Jiella endophytica]TFF19759.1 addiction module antidote protein, HigA family [Jiella endophytica]
MDLKLPLIHPGEILREDFLVPLAITPYGLAKALHIPRTRIERLAREETPVTVDTALRLARYFDTTPELWLNLQRSYDLQLETDRKYDEIAAIIPRRTDSAAA